MIFYRFPLCAYFFLHVHHSPDFVKSSTSDCRGGHRYDPDSL